MNTCEEKTQISRGGKNVAREYYFIIDTYIQALENHDYEIYITEVKPIVEFYGGEYLVRTNNVICLNEKRQPQRVIIIKFPSKKLLDDCFASDEYKKIMLKRENSVDSRGIIVPAFREETSESSSN